MKGIEITREVLEGMGFGFFVPDEGASDGWWEYTNGDDDVCLTYQHGHCSLVTVNDSIDVSNHIRTLPALRRLIRSLFGNDALPRRELSTITDEECISLASFEWPLEDGYPIRSVVRGDWGFTVHGSASNELTTTALLHVEFDGISTDAQRENIKDIYASLIDMDFHLPAFHEESHNAN